MCVFIDGLQPIIKSSIVEFDHGDEVTATLVYEKLERHCGMCNRLDHEDRECPEDRRLLQSLSTVRSRDQKLQQNQELEVLKEILTREGLTTLPDM